jgi:hypothetical protein
LKGEGRIGALQRLPEVPEVDLALWAFAAKQAHRVDDEQRSTLCVVAVDEHSHSAGASILGLFMQRPL